jgi:hypothetical protein
MASVGNASGDSEFAAAIKAGRWPPNPQAFRDIAAFHHAVADALEAAGDTSKGACRPDFAEALAGLSGAALLATHDRNVMGENGWFDHGDRHRAAGTAADDVADYQDGLQYDLNDVIAVGEHDYYAAKKRGDLAGAAEILATHLGWADKAAAHADGLITHALNRANEKFKAMPLDSHSGNDANKTNNPDQPSTDTPPSTKPDSATSTPPGANPDQPSTDLPPGTKPDSATSTPPGANPDQPSTDLPPGTSGTPGYPWSPGFPGVAPVPFSSAAGAGRSGGMGSPGLGGSGLGSFGSSPISPSSFPTSPASAPTPPSTPALSNPISQATSGFQSGLASGMGSSGAVPPSALQQAAQPYMQQSLPVAADAPPAAGGPGTPTASAGAAAAPAQVAPAAPVQSGPGGGPAAGGMMPPMGAAPLAPYSPPGAGAEPAPTSPASSSVPAAPGTPAASAGTGPLIAGPAGAVGAAGASSTRTVNPDAVAAQDLLVRLVKACPNRAMFWGVSVLRTAVGPQMVVANSVGDGGYLPPEIRLPSTVRLAVLDPALPFGWASAWMGWQSPTAILVDHYERLRYAVEGVSVSAIATSELWPRRPDCGGDFVAVRHEELLRSPLSPLMGSHRLAAADPALAARLCALDRGGDMTAWVGSVLTCAVIRAAMEPDQTGSPIAMNEDADILDLVSKGAATPAHWQAYAEEVDRRGDGAVMMPEIYAPRDADDSPSTQHARMWYQHFFAMGRIAELVKLWAAQRVNVLDIAYCGIAAGFGGIVAAVVAEIELRLAELKPDRAGG